MTTEQIEGHDCYTEACVVCLEPVSERAVIYPCNHLAFDFLCLASWLEQRPTCPLCNTEVQRVEYDWRSPVDYKTYTPRKTVQPVGPEVRPASSRDRSNSRPTTVGRWGHGQHQYQDRNQHQYQDRHQHRHQHQHPHQHHVAPPDSSSDASLERRRLVHTRNAYSLHRASQTLVTPMAFRQSLALQRKARLFLRRELHVFTYLSSSNRIEFVLEYMIGMLRRMDLKGADGAMEALIAEVLGQDGARLLLHELAAWLGSSFERLEDWDTFVQYADPEVMPSGPRNRGQIKHGRRHAVPSANS